MKISLPVFDDVRILVAGDLMLDRYWHGATERISPEAPVPVVHVRGVEQRCGGAGFRGYAGAADRLGVILIGV